MIWLTEQLIEVKKIKKNISLSVTEILGKSNIKLSSESDIDNFVNDLKSKLKEKLNDDIVINIK